jgi:hypothetical protein
MPYPVSDSIISRPIYKTQQRRLGGVNASLPMSDITGGLNKNLLASRGRQTQTVPTSPIFAGEQDRFTTTQPDIYNPYSGNDGNEGYQEPPYSPEELANYPSPEIFDYGVKGLDMLGDFAASKLGGYPGHVAYQGTKNAIRAGIDENYDLLPGSGKPNALQDTIKSATLGYASSKIGGLGKGPLENVVFGIFKGIGLGWIYDKTIGKIFGGNDDGAGGVKEEGAKAGEAAARGILQGTPGAVSNPNSGGVDARFRNDVVGGKNDPFLAVGPYSPGYDEGNRDDFIGGKNDPYGAVGPYSGDDSGATDSGPIGSPGDIGSGGWGDADQW